MITRSSSFEGMESPKVVGTGLVALDVLLQDGEFWSNAALGGSTGNVLAILAFLGWSAVPVARLGKDNAGKKITSEFASLKADTRFLTQDELTTTPIVYQSPGESGATHKFSFSCPFCGTKRSFVPGSDTSFCSNVLANVHLADVFYFDRVTPWALHLAEAYRQRGALIMFEPSKVETDRAAFQQAIWSSNILKYADDRIDDLESFDRSTVDVEIQTAGAEGLRFRQPSAAIRDWYFLSALRVSEIADSAGAGDWCTAGLLYFLSQKKSGRQLSLSLLSNALRYGQMLAALNCMLPGARGLARSLDEKFTKEQLAKLLHSEYVGGSSPQNWASVVNTFVSISQGRITHWNVHMRQNPDLDQSTSLCCETLGS